MQRAACSHMLCFPHENLHLLMWNFTRSKIKLMRSVSLVFLAKGSTTKKDAFMENYTGTCVGHFRLLFKPN